MRLNPNSANVEGTQATVILKDYYNGAFDLNVFGSAASQLLQIVPGPDFPTAGIINGTHGIRQAYNTGRGKIYVRARTEVEPRDKGRESIIIT